MKRLWRWFLLVLLLGGLALFVAAVPVGGQTVLERIAGRAGPAGATGRPAEQAPAAGTDRLTDQDREGLNKLIESKLNADDQEGGEAKVPPKK